MKQGSSEDKGPLICARHKQAAIRFCVSEGCENSCVICPKCFADHDHPDMTSIRTEELSAMASFAETKISANARQLVTNGLAEFRSFAAEVRQAVDMVLA